MNQLSKVIIAATMIGSFSLLCLVGCSAEYSNKNESDSKTEGNIKI
ncbi:MAG: hypothetical protein ACKPER_19030 [Dolichospermum sp.]